MSLCQLGLMQKITSTAHTYIPSPQHVHFYVSAYVSTYMCLRLMQEITSTATALTTPIQAQTNATLSISTDTVSGYCCQEGHSATHADTLGASKRKKSSRHTMEWFWRLVPPPPPAAVSRPGMKNVN